MRILSRAEFFRETPGLQIILFSKVYITALRKSLHAHHLRRVFFSDLTREPLQYLVHSLFSFHG